MKLVEFASAEEQLALWKLVSDNVWGAISQQAKAEAKQKALKKAQAKKAPKNKARVMPLLPNVPPPPKMPTLKPIQQPYVRSVVSKPATPASGLPQQAVGATKSIQPKMPANVQQPQGGHLAFPAQKSALTSRKTGFSAE